MAAQVQDEFLVYGCLLGGQLCQRAVVASGSHICGFLTMI